MPFVRIRLALHGCLKRPFYHIVVATNKSKRDGKHIEQVGCFDPMPNYNDELIVGLNTERIKYWLSVGAIPTVAVSKLLGLAGITPVHPRLYLEASRNRQAKAEKRAQSAESARTAEDSADSAVADCTVDDSTDTNKS